MEINMNVESGNCECHGGVGFQQPSHTVPISDNESTSKMTTGKCDTMVDENGLTYVPLQEHCCVPELNRVDNTGANKSHVNCSDSNNITNTAFCSNTQTFNVNATNANRSMTSVTHESVHNRKTCALKGGRRNGMMGSLCRRHWSLREKYLMIVCTLLFFSCVAFVFIAFLRDNPPPEKCPCQDVPVIQSYQQFSQDDPMVPAKSQTVLICNLTFTKPKISNDLDLEYGKEELQLSKSDKNNIDQNYDSGKDSHHTRSHNRNDLDLSNEDDLGNSDLQNDSGYDIEYWWTLPNEEMIAGNKLVLDGGIQETGPYTCHVKVLFEGRDYRFETSNYIGTDTFVKKQDICLSGNCIQTAAQLLGSMDATVDPCDNFFQFACGNWNKKNFIPEDRTSYNTFEKLYDDLQLNLRALLEDSPKDYDSEATLKAKTLYHSCIDVTQIEKIGDAPLRRLLESLGRWPVIDQLWSEDDIIIEDIIGDMRGKYNAPILMDAWIGADDKNSSVNILQLDEPALGMPSREYYLHDKDSADIKAYLKYMCDVTKLMGANPDTVEAEMTKVVEFETKIANATKPQHEKHDTGARYNKVTLGHLHDTIPKFDWVRYLNRYLPETVDRSEEVVVFAPDFLKKMVDLLQVTDKRTISNFILWRLILGFIPELTVSFQEVRNEYRKVLQGVTRDKPRWNKCVEYVNDRLGPATGAMFVHERFRKESKVVAMEMISNLRVAFIDLLEENDWMDDDTRAVARDKANAVRERIGYPDYIVNPVELDKKLENLDFKADAYFENILAVEQYDANKMFQRFRQMVNKDVWEQDPAIVNAFYNPNTNDIVFPAGMLQPPFYSEYFPKSLNYGGIGVVIGHEITHGFDDKGRQYDKDGNMKQWWKNNTIEAFQKRTECIVKQYSNVQLEQIGKNIDGKNTQGENIADNGGLKQAYRAYKMWEHTHGPEPLLPGLNMSHDQLFFLNFAQIWCGNMRDQAALEKIRTSAHSPGPIRARLPLANSEDFARAYSCPLGSRMNPKHKCSIW